MIHRRAFLLGVIATIAVRPHPRPKPFTGVYSDTYSSTY